MNSPVVKFTNVSKTYSMFRKKSDKLLEILSFRNNDKSFAALSNVSFEVFKGETIGIIGINGSGKSTLSSILAQVTPQTSGDIEINGETSLVAISVGLNNQLTGLENIELKCLMHGLTKEQIREITPDIIEFADIGDFIKQPLKSYSSGMRSRLGFAISAFIQPDILVIDEALSVGDSTFYEKCLNKFDEFKEQGKTIFFISHSLSQVKAISDRILWLNFGKVKMFGDANEVAMEYSEFIQWFNELSKQEQKSYRKKMLGEQMSGNYSRKDKRVRRDKKRNQKRKYSLIFQTGFFLSLFFISTLLMFVDYPINTLKGYLAGPLEEKYQAEEKPSVESVQVIDESGYIIEREASLYKDADLESEIIKIPFASQVNVIEDISDSVYKVKLNEMEGFMKPEVVLLIEDNEMDESGVTVEDFLPILPGQFKEAYSFFFTFLNSEYDEVKNSLHGLSNEYVDEFGRTVLEFDNISYIFDEEKSIAIQVNDVMMSDDYLDSVLKGSTLSSNDATLHYFSSNAYGIYIDIESGSITFSLILE